MKIILKNSKNKEIAQIWASWGTAAIRNVTNNTVRFAVLWLADTRQAGFLK